MIALHRHQLVHLKPEAWSPILATADNAAAHAGFSHWAEHDLPLVVARQDGGGRTLTRKLGLPLPDCWGRQRLGLLALPTQVARVAEFPAAFEVASLMTSDATEALRRLCADLAAIRVRALAYGSYGWQRMTGLRYVRESSDLDLLLCVDDATAADAAVALMAAFPRQAPRLDGELIFGDGTAVAWREWGRWRSGQVAQILLRRLNGEALAAGMQWLEQATAGAMKVSA
jgi:phosphoribosyl-dephospho-CoA transferase